MVILKELNSVHGISSNGDPVDLEAGAGDRVVGVEDHLHPVTMVSHHQHNEKKGLSRDLGEAVKKKKNCSYLELLIVAGFNLKE